MPDEVMSAVDRLVASVKKREEQESADDALRALFDEARNRNTINPEEPEEDDAA